jgi:hypothetical protein
MAMNVAFSFHPDQHVRESAGGRVHSYLENLSMMSTSIYAYANHHRWDRALWPYSSGLPCQKALEGFAGIQSFPVVKWQFDPCQKSVSTLLELLFLRPQASGLSALSLRPQRVASSHFNDHSDGDCLP